MRAAGVMRTLCVVSPSQIVPVLLESVKLMPEMPGLVYVW